ncbi:MAG: HAD hydrolase family protein [Eubacterium sp.]|nr:HAD hydrolase family protein [Eubacterium sp.]
MSTVKLIAYDLDGTLLTEKKELTARTSAILEKASSMGIELVVTTGRALSGIPDAVKAVSGCKYVITSNGAGIYRRKQLIYRDKSSLPDDGAESYTISNDSYELVAEHLMDNDRAREILGEFGKLQVMPDPFIDGKCYMRADKAYLIDQMDVYDAMKEYIRDSRTLVENMDEFLKDKDIQKITVNFACDENKHRIDSEKVFEIASRYPEFVAVEGGIRNIEFSAAKATKGNALLELLDSLGIDPADAVAFGDSENDISMLKAVGTGVAMANSLRITKEAADKLTLSNDEEGVAAFLEEILQD